MREKNILNDNFLPFPTENGLKICSLSEPQWFHGDYAEISKNDLFSEERWGKTVNWNVLYEQTKSISSIINLLDENIFPSTLFDTYLDILKANLDVFSNIFYFLTGEKIIKESIFSDDTQCVKKILHRLEFWNLDCKEKIEQISTLFTQMDTRLTDILNSTSMQPVRSLVNRHTTPGSTSVINSVSGKYRAYVYAFAEYKYPYNRDTAEKVAKKIIEIITAIDNYNILFGLIERLLPDLDFNYLLIEFRKSNRWRSLEKAWTPEMEASRDRLVDQLEKDPKLGLWVYRYLHLRDNENIITQLFYDENTGEIIDKEKCYNTDNWISILTIAAILQVYDEFNKHNNAAVTNNYKPVKSFQEFIKDAHRTEEIIEKLHRLIGNKTNTEALRIITKAMWIDWIDRPSATSIKNEFPTITCSETIFSRCLNEAKPHKGGKINEDEIERIRKEYEQA